MGVETVAAAVGGLVEKSAISKTMRHIIPFMALCYFVAFLDRINVGMAAITMNKSHVAIFPASAGIKARPARALVLSGWLKSPGIGDESCCPVR
jgi:hypothetical protein